MKKIIYSKNDYKVKEYKDIKQIKKEWISSFNNSNFQIPFLTYEWFENLQHSYNFSIFRKRTGCELRYFVLEKSNSPIIIAPFDIDFPNKKILSMGCNVFHIDYYDFICVKSVMPSDVRLLLNAVKNQYSEFSLKIRNVNEQSSLFSLLDENKAEKSDTCLKICVDNDYDNYIKGLSKSVRQNIRTAHNRLKTDEMKYEFTLHFCEKLNNKKIKELNALYFKRQAEAYNQASSDKSLCSSEKIDLRLKNLGIRKDYIERYMKKYLCKNAVAAECKINGTLCAVFIGFIHNRTVMIPRLAINSDFGKYSPGMLMLTDTLYELRDKIDYLDLTRGNEKYKYDLGGVEHFDYLYLI